MKAIKRVVTKKNFRKYNIPERFGDMAVIIILPYSNEVSTDDDNFNSWFLMKAQEKSGSMNVLNESEESAWDSV